MASTTTSQPQTLTFPAATFAKLSPASYLLTHLRAPSPLRPSGRTPSQARHAHVHSGSLTHAHGSAVVRLGDTAVVCGVRGEILRVDDAAGWRGEGTGQGTGEGNEAKMLDLLVPNVELATGCSPAFLPGAPPGKRAQELVSRVYSLLHASQVIPAGELRIWGAKAVDGDEPEEDDMEEGEGKMEVKGFWTLYIDILFISLDGNAFDAAWASVIAALRDVRLPAARWDGDNARIVCDDAISAAKQLQLRGLPIAVSAAVFRGEGESWVLSDPDAFEEEVCAESVSVVVDCSRGRGVETRVLGIQKVGGVEVGRSEMRRIVAMAEDRWAVWEGLMKG